MDDDDDDLFGDVPAVRRPAKKPKPSTSLLDSFMVADAKKASRLESLRLQNAASREKVASTGTTSAARRAAPPPAKKLVDGSDDEDGVGGALDDEVYEAVIGAALPAHLGSPDEATAAKLLAQARFELSRDAGAARECKDSNAVALAEYGLLEAFAQLAAEDDATRRPPRGGSRAAAPARPRLVEALEEAYGAHYVTTQRGLGAAAGLRKLDVGAALIRWLQLLVAFDARDAVAFGAAETLAKLAETHDAATRPLLTPDVVTLVLRHYVKAPLDLGEALGGAGPGSTSDGNAPAPRRLARCLGVWAACVDAGAAALDAPALAALGKVCAGVVAPAPRPRLPRVPRAARDLARAALLAAADFDGFGDLLAPALLAPTLAPPDRALIEDAAQALKRKLRNEMDPMAARNIELLDALLTDLKLDTTKKVSKQTTLDFAAK
ncbi:hypothetical protein JL720_6127 [Aureococcus anophagefferens]|nr:hypothetical protein JL720_6127 [Aureococcus anophagefferens]